VGGVFEGEVAAGETCDTNVWVGVAVSDDGVPGGVSVSGNGVLVTSEGVTEPVDVGVDTGSVGVRVNVGVSVGGVVGVRVNVGVTVGGGGVFVRVGVAVGTVGVGVFDEVGVAVGTVGDGVFVRVGVAVGTVGVAVGVFVRVGVAVSSGVLVTSDGVVVLVGVAVIVAVLVGVGVRVGVRVGVDVGVGVRVGVFVGWTQFTDRLTLLLRKICTGADVPGCVYRLVSAPAPPTSVIVAEATPGGQSNWTLASGPW
jgi:hypothetical protein